MDIKIASNTPALVKKILGSNTFTSSDEGNIDKQIFTIDSTALSYTDNSVITITSIETYYSALGLLNTPSDTATAERLNTINLPKDISEELVPPVVETIPDLKKSYDEILTILTDSTEAHDYILKETYLLLGLQNLVNIDYTLSEYFATNDNIKYGSCHDNLKEFINDIWHVILSICESIQYLNALIGLQSISHNYGQKITDKLIPSINLFNNILENLKETDSSFSDDGRLSLISIENSLQDWIVNIEVSENKIPLFKDFENVCSKMIDAVNLTLKIISSSASYKSNSNSIDPVYSLISTTDLIKYTISAMDSATSGISDNYSLIMSSIKSALSSLVSITAVNNDVNLINQYNKNILLKKSSTKTFNSSNINEKSETVFLPSFNFVSGSIQTSINNSPDKNVHKSQKDKADNNYLNVINDSLTDGYTTMNSDDDTASAVNTITKSVNLNLSFYVCNLNIRVSGTIGSENFTGYIFYSNLYNLSYFGINDTNVTVDVDIPESTDSFNVSECLSPSLQASSVIPSSNYSLTSPDSFNADIELAFSLSGEVLITAVVPIVFAK